MSFVKIYSDPHKDLIIVNTRNIEFVQPKGHGSYVLHMVSGRPFTITKESALQLTDYLFETTSNDS